MNNVGADVAPAGYAGITEAAKLLHSLLQHHGGGGAFLLIFERKEKALIRGKGGGAEEDANDDSDANLGETERVEVRSFEDGRHVREMQPKLS